MKKVFIAALAFGSALSGGAAFAGPTEDMLSRLDALEKENAAIRKENAALMENKSLRERNVAIKSSIKNTRATRPAVQDAVSTPAPKTASADLSSSRRLGETKSDVFGAYAADLPIAYKAAPPETPGQLRLWGEGGAIWSGGDPVSQDFNLTDFTGIGGLGGGIGGGIGGGTIPRTFDLTPKVGWEAAAGFDYRFAGSPWHVSGQFRYGEGGKTGGSAVSAGSLDPSILALLGGGGGGGGGGVVSSVSGSESVAANYKETHWLADIAVGRDIAGNGRDALQLKGGLRVAEFVATTDTSDSVNSLFNFSAPVAPLPGGPAVTAFGTSTSSLVNTRSNFLGAGPLVGLQGSAPFAGKWSFDYSGDAAVLFGDQNSVVRTTTTTAVSPAVLGALGGFGGSGVTTFSTQRFATVFSADIQVGISYWVMENVKVGVSYRLDAMINVQNQDDPAVTNLTPDRYTHGPRVTVTGQF